MNYTIIIFLRKVIKITITTNNKPYPMYYIGKSYYLLLVFLLLVVLLLLVP